MKKFAVLGLAVVLVIAFTMPAMAIESVFGGYWRTRAYTQVNFNGTDDGAQDVTAVDTRTRLYYTAIFNENFKFVNQFEMDAAWGGAAAGYGDIGADGVSVEVKHSYADFNLGPVNFKIGVQPYKIARGFLFNADFAGAVINYKAEAFEIPFIWVKAYEGGMGDDANDYDVDYYGIAPKFSFGDTGSIQPFLVYAMSEDVSASGLVSIAAIAPPGYYATETDVYYLGLDADLNFDPISLWLTGIYQFGTITGTDGIDSGDADISAYLAALGAKANLGAFDVHGQIFYATGQSDDADDIEAYFAAPLAQDYHWAEIMGGGMFDVSIAGLNNTASNNAPGWNAISNVLAYNIGASFKPMDDLTIKLDAWQAQLAEDDANGDTDLGTEVDLGLTYKLLEGLNLDIVGAYLFAGDSTTENVENDANPYEIGTQLSLSF